MLSVVVFSIIINSSWVLQRKLRCNARKMLEGRIKDEIPQNGLKPSKNVDKVAPVVYNLDQFNIYVNLKSLVRCPGKVCGTTCKHKFYQRFSKI